MQRKDKLFNMRVSEEWITERKIMRDKMRPELSLSQYLVEMIAYGEGWYSGLIREEESDFE